MKTTLFNEVFWNLCLQQNFEIFEAETSVWLKNAKRFESELNEVNESRKIDSSKNCQTVETFNGL